MAIKANLLIDQGVDYSTILSLTNDDGEVVTLAGYSANAQMRKTYTSSTAYTFSTTVDDTLGTITLSMTANQTANIVSGRYVYDVFTTDGSGLKSRVVEGIVTVTPRVTR